MKDINQITPIYAEKCALFFITGNGKCKNKNSDYKIGFIDIDI